MIIPKPKIFARVAWISKELLAAKLESAQPRTKEGKARERGWKVRGKNSRSHVLSLYFLD